MWDHHERIFQLVLQQSLKKNKGWSFAFNNCPTHVEACAPAYFIILNVCWMKLANVLNFVAQLIEEFVREDLTFKISSIVEFVLPR